MEQLNALGGRARLSYCGHALPSGMQQRNSYVDSVLTDAVLSELKKQSANGCLLCSLDALDAEEWD
jgi:hypothetical protein